MVWFSVVVQVRATPGGVAANVCCPVTHGTL